MIDPIHELEVRAEILHARVQEHDTGALKRLRVPSEIARYPNKCCGHLNRWYKTYEEAAAIRKDCRGYLLGYRHQYVVVDRYFIETLGLDPDDPDWEALGFDWVRPAEITARTRLYSKLVAQLPREAA